MRFIETLLLCLPNKFKNAVMKELEDKVYILIGRNGKIKTAEMLGMTFSTLASRLYKGGWKKIEIDLIESLSV